jgi:hypothetical protein
MTELAGVLDRHEATSRQRLEEYAAKWPVAKRHAALKSGDALPGDPPKFPIKDQDDMDNANRLLGSSSVPKATVVSHMRKQAKRHGLKLPGGLQSNSTS